MASRMQMFASDMAEFTFKEIMLTQPTATATVAPTAKLFIQHFNYHTVFIITYLGRVYKHTEQSVDIAMTMQKPFSDVGAFAKYQYDPKLDRISMTIEKITFMCKRADTVDMEERIMLHNVELNALASK